MQRQDQKQELREHCVSVRLNSKELRELDRRRGKVQKGVFLRRLFLGKKEPAQIPQPNREAYSETARWASALNQIARRLNEGEDVDIESTRATLAEFRRALLGLVKGNDSED